MLRRYDNPSDVTMRLAHSYVRYKGEPCFIQDVSGFNLYASFDEQKSPIVLSAEDPDLDISAMPTGYCLDVPNHRTFWIARHPYRQQKQGLDRHNAISILEGKDFSVQGPMSEMPYVSAIKDMVHGSVRTLDDAFGKLRSGRFHAVPLARNFCLVAISDAKHTFGLKFMSSAIGLVDSRSANVLLSHKYRESPVEGYLKETFSKVTIEEQGHAS